MDTNNTNEGKVKVYELGYLLVPTIAEENVAGEAQTIKNSIESKGATFITEDSPKLRPLAYEMTKSLGSQRAKYDKGYFGWIKFEMEPKSAPELKVVLDKNAMILRSMLIETVRENTLIGQKMVYRPAPGVGADKAKIGEEPKVSEEELDKTIENLVVE